METLITSKPALETMPDLGEQVVLELLSKEFPVTVHAVQDVSPMDWANKYKEQINHLLQSHGAILFRGFKIGSAQGFNELFGVVAGEPMEYKNRTSPRQKVYNNVYTSTTHPKDQYIYMHTENSYSLTFNRIIAFFCLIPSSVGGETPIADERKILTSLKKETIEKFRKKKILYLRNSSPGVGLDWRTIYQTDDRRVVNAYLDANQFEYVWLSDDHLRVKWVLPAIQKHPLTGEEVWFNHLYFGLKEHYAPEILDYFTEEELPFATYYGDGTTIEKSVVDEFNDFYKNNSIVFKWKKDDFLLLDNMMFSHGRNPFSGERTILTAMAQPINFIKS